VGVGVHDQHLVFVVQAGQQPQHAQVGDGEPDQRETRDLRDAGEGQQAEQRIGEQAGGDRHG